MRRAEFRVDGPGGLKDRVIAYTDWGEPDNPRILVCAHGLTRTGRDFDVIAEALSGTYRVICPDAAGRGRSGWLARPEDYAYAAYVTDTQALLAHVGAGRVDWIGTSMGGFLGLMLAALPDPPIRKMVMNDIGPFLPKEALRRIAGYLVQERTFADTAAIEAHLRDVHAPFGALSDDQWRRLAEHSTRPLDGGGVALHYDPAIAAGFAQAAGADIDVWEIWDRIACPVLVVRGESSDLLSPETARDMAGRGPRAEIAEIPGCGHAPALMDPAQIEIVGDWLRGTA